jgi:hypothetical protein
MQSPDEPVKDYEVKTIGEVTSLGNWSPMPVSGVGLVTGLDGTGGGTPPGDFKVMLEEQLRKLGIENTKQVLADPRNALVLISAQIPPGARKGEHIDLHVTLPPQSKVTSLRGGTLQETVLFNFESSKSINPNAASNRLIKGHVLAHASGPLLVGFGDGDEAARLRQGRIWGGGVTVSDFPFYLVLNKDKKFAYIANLIAERINLTFHEDAKKRLLVLHEVTQGMNDKFKGASLGSGDIAQAKNKDAVYIRVPYEYRHNPERYLHVARLIPLRESNEALTKYRCKLEQCVLDPAKTVSAALRLEALGKDSIAALKRGLESDHTLVRFCAAEALAYLGSTLGAEELARLADDHEMLRAFCLTALASLDEPVCHYKLASLMASPSAETRYGAFRALQTLEDDERTPGEQLNNSFWLHRVAPHAPPLVHLSTNRRAEIVLFGEEPKLQPPVKILAGPEFTVTAERDDVRCTVTRFAVQQGSIRRKMCGLGLEEVLRTLAELGGTYPDAVDLLRQAERWKALSCALRVDALPEAPNVEALAAGGRDPEFLRQNPNLLKGDDDLGSTPALFSRGADSQARAEDVGDEEPVRHERPAAGRPGAN